MNAIFSFNRFGYYGLRKLLFSKSQYIYLMTFIGATYLLTFLFYLLTGGVNNVVCKTVILISIILAPCLFSTPINKYNDTLDYTFPASNMERFLYIWGKYTILIPLFTFGFYYLINMMTGLLPAYNFFANEMKIPLDYGVAHGTIGIQSVYLAGQLSFRKNAFMKTTLLGLLVFIGFGLLTNLIKDTDAIIQIKTSEPVPYNPSDSRPFTFFHDPTGVRVIGKLKWLDHFWECILPAGMWIISFFKIREKEI